MTRHNGDTIWSAYDAGMLTVEELGRYLDRTTRGEEVYAYTSIDGRWYVWDEGVIDPKTGYEGVRVPLRRVRDYDVSEAQA